MTAEMLQVIVQPGKHMRQMAPKLRSRSRQTICTWFSLPLEYRRKGKTIFVWDAQRFPKEYELEGES